MSGQPPPTGMNTSALRFEQPTITAFEPSSCGTVTVEAAEDDDGSGDGDRDSGGSGDGVVPGVPDQVALIVVLLLLAAGAVVVV